jgi:predicted nucleotidyltransferase
MNIKITKQEHDFLQKHVIKTYIVGSHLYGVQNEQSDVDFLCIYKSPWELFPSQEALPSIHQFQYDDGTTADYLYTNEVQFWKNQQSGDSTINSDVVMFSGEWDEDVALDMCRTYKVIKAYLGFANRDLKQVAKIGEKKLKHAIRGIYCAKSLMFKKLPKLSTIRNHPTDVSVKFLQDECQRLRDTLNQMYNVGEIESYFVPKTRDTLLQKLLDSNNTKEFKY